MSFARITTTFPIIGPGKLLPKRILFNLSVPSKFPEKKSNLPYRG
jgi:hypothetical protein